MNKAIDECKHEERYVVYGAEYCRDCNEELSNDEEPFELIQQRVNQRLKMNNPKCHICNTFLSPKARHSQVLNGFLDQDTAEYVHHANKCRNEHYHRKFNNGMPGLYSEVPVTKSN